MTNTKIYSCMEMCMADGSKSNDITACEEECNQRQQQGGSKRLKPKKGTYEAMTVKELRERCVKRCIKYKGVKKEELIRRLRAYGK